MHSACSVGGFFSAWLVEATVALFCRGHLNKSTWQVSKFGSDLPLLMIKSSYHLFGLLLLTIVGELAAPGSWQREEEARRILPWEGGSVFGHWPSALFCRLFLLRSQEHESNGLTRISRCYETIPRCIFMVVDDVNGEVMKMMKRRRDIGSEIDQLGMLAHRVADIIIDHDRARGRGWGFPRRFLVTIRFYIISQLPGSWSFSSAFVMSCVQESSQIWPAKAV